MHFINATLQIRVIWCILINVDVNLMHAILQHCYFKAPLFHYKTLLVHDSSIGSSESLSFELIGST